LDFDAHTDLVQRERPEDLAVFSPVALDVPSKTERGSNRSNLITEKVSRKREIARRGPLFRGVAACLQKRARHFAFLFGCVGDHEARNSSGAVPLGPRLSHCAFPAPSPSLFRRRIASSLRSPSACDCFEGFLSSGSDRPSLASRSRASRLDFVLSAVRVFGLDLYAAAVPAAARWRLTFC
jgi:hypothetical protein